MSRIGEDLIREEVRKLFQEQFGVEPLSASVSEHRPAQVTFRLEIDSTITEVRIPEEVLQSSPLSYVSEAYLRKAVRRLAP